MGIVLGASKWGRGAPTPLGACRRVRVRVDSVPAPYLDIRRFCAHSAPPPRLAVPSSQSGINHASWADEKVAGRFASQPVLNAAMIWWMGFTRHGMGISTSEAGEAAGNRKRKQKQEVERRREEGGRGEGGGGRDFSSYE